MPKVLILTAGYGEGHNAAARGLQAAFAELGADADIVDLFAVTGGRFYAHSRRGYVELINRAPRLWAAFYQCIDRVPVGALTAPLLGKMQRALEALLAVEKPVAVVSVYPTYGYLIARLSRRDFGFYTVVTDSITINSVWHRCASDHFIVANEETAQVIMKRVPAEKVRVLGFPVHPQFSRERPPRQPPDAQTPARVLYMVNAGRSQAPEIVRQVLALPHLQLTVTVGRDEALGTELQEIARQMNRPLEILGWTQRMPELLMSHHVLIGKAGGATVQETIAAGTPMLLTQIVPGQEEGNAQLLLENGCGALCPTAAELASALAQAFAHDAAGWRVWQRNIARLSRPNAARDIGRFVLEQGTVKPLSNADRHAAGLSL